MTSLTIRLALWEEFTGLYFSERTFKILETYGFGLGMGMGFDPSWNGRKLTLEFCNLDTCNHVVEAPSGEEPYRCQFRLLPKTARCTVFEVEATLIDERLEYVLPADHLLPWPYLRECKAFDKLAVARREIKTRIASAGRHSATFRLSDIPREFQEIITAQERMEIYRSAQ